MGIFVFLSVFFGTFAALNWFSLNSAISFSFIGRFSLIFILLIMGGYHINEALSINELTENASETQRNLIFFGGVFEIMFGVGFIFVRSLKWTSFVLIAFLGILITLNIFGVLRDFRFAQFGDPISYPNILFEYIAVAIWTLIFGIIYRGKEGVFGLKGKGW